MRILVLSNLYPPDGLGGYERACQDVADQLVAMGHELEILTSVISLRLVPEDQSNKNVRRWLHISNEYAPLITGKIAGYLDAVASKLVSRHNISVMLDALDQFRPDVVLVSNVLGLGGLQLLSALESLKVPWAWLLEDLIPLSLLDLGGISDLLEDSPFSSGGKHSFSGTFISPSQRLYDDIESGGCALDGVLHLVPNSVPALPPLNRKYYKPGDCLRICHAGYISHHKGVDIVLNAIAQLVRSGVENVFLDLYGAGQIERFSEIAFDLGISSRVSFHGFKDRKELFRCYTEHDVFLFPARSDEPFGNVAIEAAACGCLPIIYEGCGAAEWMEEGETCIKVSRDPESFVTALKAVLDGSTDLILMASRAATEVRVAHDVATNARKFAEVLKTIAKPFAVSAEDMMQVRVDTFELERKANARIEVEYQEQVRQNDWQVHEIKELNTALAEAKRGMDAFQMALTGAENKLTMSESEVERLSKSRALKLAQAVKFAWARRKS